MSDNFVLVHGAWHGAWCWASVIGELEREGHRALAVDLPAHGANPMDPAKVTLEIYADSVVRFIEDRDLKNVVLAGHSLGGLTISAVAERIPKRIKRVIWVSAMVMLDGEVPAVDLAKSTNQLASFLKPVGEHASMLPAEPFRKYFIQDASRDLQDFVISALVPEPTVTLGASATRNFRKLDLPTSYIICEDDLCLGDPKLWHPGFSGRLKNPTMRSIKCSHEVMFTRPVECARALSELARG
jgi:pimeloyl-ACP methyl ester carboxylesterase